MRNRSGGNTSIPQVFINGFAIGSMEELEAYFAASAKPGSAL